MDYDQGVTRQGGASRLMGALQAAICLAPLLILGMTGLVGWNEKNAVCQAKQIEAGRVAAHDASCNMPTAFSGDLILATCDLSKDGLKALSGNGDFDAQSYVGVGIKAESSMYCCKEESHSSTKKDKVGGGTTTETTYSYSMEWVQASDFSSDCPSSFHDPSEANYQCGVRSNPSWPAGAPTSKSWYVDKVKAGSFSIIEPDMIASVPLDTPIATWSAPVGWRSGASSGSFESKKACKSQAYNDCIGMVRVSFKSNDWSRKTVTFAGENSNGAIDAWKAPASWMCGGERLANLEMGRFTRDAFFDLQKKRAETLTWILRLVGFLVLWLAFAMCFRPFEVMLDCIPCIGPMLGDCFNCAVCVISCLPATACFFGVAGFMWCFMRPLVGIPLMLIWIAVMCRTGYYTYQKRHDISSQMGAMQQGLTRSVRTFDGSPAQPFSSEFGGPPAAPVVAQPVQPRQMQVTVPEGCAPGTLVEVMTPEGVKVQTHVPAGVQPGSTFPLNY